MIGWKITRSTDKTSLYISQPHLTQTYINMLRIQEAKPTKTPYPYGIQLQAKQPQESTLDTAKYTYVRAVGILRYLVDSTRPDLAYIVGALARHTKTPTKRDWLAIKHIALYLLGTKYYGLPYTAGNNNLNAQSDADFARCSDTRPSTYAGVMYLWSCLNSWRSRRIKSVSTCTFEAEYIAVSNTFHHIYWLSTLIQEIIGHDEKPTRIGIDNKGAIAATKAQAPTKRTKYIDIRYHHVQELVANGTISPYHIPTDVLQADALTKPLAPTKYLKHQPKL